MEFDFERGSALFGGGQSLPFVVFVPINAKAGAQPLALPFLGLRLLALPDPLPPRSLKRALATRRNGKEKPRLS